MAGIAGELADGLTELLDALPDAQRPGRRDAEAIAAHARALAAIQRDEPTDSVLAALRTSAAAAQLAGARQLRGRALARITT